MKVLIPVKTNSKRVANKNFREFYKGDSLLDILLKKIVKFFKTEDIYISCDDPLKKDVADKYCVNFLLREKKLTYNETPMSDVIPSIIKQIPDNDEVAWILVTDPIFNEHERVLQTWNMIDHSIYDSLAVVYPIKHYLLDSNYQPIDFGFGENHIPSQELKPKYQLNHTMFICNREVYFENKYYIGNTPYWYHANSYPSDIDTETDFRIVQAIYERIYSNE